ncbi:hypothetical protein GL213_04430 [Halogeometricum borinquense]|uniref:Uncharacterized protein n=2 Tax=Halogeometricum borinquense TaxID=60847 RepID=E4NPC8_HALBP|nr:hypothetical protein [Halogeometricum borinquense]ADQ66483.1 hypothetical protein Hbor_08870 [Halogeometricum borinquense DSM 11551]ELY31201.1 hypothetical protein C499_01955 [Halogeometricum borinquense DSM 11551]QIB75188.1 hypothetical protein G3I44_13400 [Halogeometricum borinquense]QIQ75836.1 hypothetical protein GL213_04430 [Halogeometricum borinquense]RYJ14348.1 hypothetical protein ELS19_10550 [Halogeometricum borinquense]
MGLLTSKKALVGLVLMVVGTLAFVPSALGTASVPVYALAVAALVLTAGTWLVGTSGDGRPV